MTALIDAAIFMYAAGAAHPLKQPSITVLARARARSLDATTSAEVVQEIFHRYRAIGRTAGGIALTREVLVTFTPVLPITDAVVRRLPELAERYSNLSSRDLVHVATCIEHGLDTIISPDRGFDEVSEIMRVNPSVAPA